MKKNIEKNSSPGLDVAPHKKIRINLSLNESVHSDYLDAQFESMKELIRKFGVPDFTKATFKEAK